MGKLAVANVKNLQIFTNGLDDVIGSPNEYVCLWFLSDHWRDPAASTQHRRHVVYLIASLPMIQRDLMMECIYMSKWYISAYMAFFFFACQKAESTMTKQRGGEKWTHANEQTVNECVVCWLRHKRVCRSTLTRTLIHLQPTAFNLI